MNSEHRTVHSDHDHQHDAARGHTAVKHDDHVDFLHDGHLHHPTGQGDEVEEYTLAVSERNPADCTDGKNNGGHEPGHTHGPDCGHEAVPHGDHTDYLVDGHLHHPHAGHCDDHGAVEVVDAKAA